MFSGSFVLKQVANSGYNRTLLDEKSKSGNIELLDILSKGGAVKYGCSFIVRKEGAKRFMESMRDVYRVMEREIKRGSTPPEFATCSKIK